MGYSEPEDNDDNDYENNDDYETDDYRNDDDYKNDNYENDDDNNNNKKNIKNNEEIIIDNKNTGTSIMDDLRILLKKAIISNNEGLMNKR